MRNETFPFVDELGRPSDKPRDFEHGITDNPLLFLGELLLLKQSLGELTFEGLCYVEQILVDCRVQKGLYSRHPKSFFEKYPFTVNKMSHDENNGIAFIALSIPMLRYHLLEMIDYLKEHGNQYYDLEPNSNFFNALKRNPLDTLKKLKLYLDDLKANPNNTNAVDLNHDGDIVAISAYRQPRDIAFYKIAAGQKASLLSILWLSIAIMLSTRSSLEDGSRGGKMLLAWFRNLALRKCKIDGLKYLPIRLAIKFFNWRLTSKYGEEFPVVLIGRYFDLRAENGSRHPMIYLVKKYVDRFGV